MSKVVCCCHLCVSPVPSVATVVFCSVPCTQSERNKKIETGKTLTKNRKLEGNQEHHKAENSGRYNRKPLVRRNKNKGTKISGRLMTKNKIKLQLNNFNEFMLYIRFQHVKTIDEDIFTNIFKELEILVQKMLQRGPLIVSYAKSIAKYEFRISNV